jgi:hypothetical protein
VHVVQLAKRCVDGRWRQIVVKAGRVYPAGHRGDRPIWSSDFDIVSPSLPGRRGVGSADPLRRRRPSSLGLRRNVEAEADQMLAVRRRGLTPCLRHERTLRSQIASGSYLWDCVHMGAFGHGDWPSQYA